MDIIGFLLLIILAGLWGVRDTGFIGNNNCTHFCWGIRPVVEMNEGVYIASGTGTDEDPYILAKE